VAFVISIAEQRRVQHYVAAEKGEGVNFVVIDEIEVERGFYRIGVRDQTHTQPVDILHQQRVVNQGRAAAQLTDIIIAHLKFLTDRERAAR